MASRGKKSTAGGEVKAFGVSLPVPRTFSAIDRLLARPLENLEEYLDRRKAENAKSHVDAVKREADKANRALPDDLSVHQVQQIQIWTRHAENVGAEDEKLSAAWRAALERILTGSPTAEELIYALSNLTSRQIRLIATINDAQILKLARSDREDFARNRLIIEPEFRISSYITKHRFKIITLTSMAISILSTPFLMYSMLGSYSFHISETTATLMRYSLFLPCSLVLVWMMLSCFVDLLIQLTATPKISSIGREFQESYLRYAIHRSSGSENLSQ